MAGVQLDSHVSTLHMTISSISKLNATLLFSPEVIIHGIPSQMCAKKNEEKNSLSVFFLHCSKKDKSSNWVVAAEATIQLLPVDGVNDALVHHISSFVFGSLRNTYGYPRLER